MNLKVLLKKSMTKKKYREEMSKNRAGTKGRTNTGTITFRSKKDYDRQREKEDTRRADSEDLL